RDGRPTRPSIIWADTRSSTQCDQLLQRLGAERGYQILGHRLNPTYSLTKLMWLRDCEPHAFAQAEKMCLAKDYVVYRLTGALATDPSDASSTNAYDQRAGSWSDELLAAAELPVGLFPDIVESTAVVGSVGAAAASECGLAAGTPVVMGGGDGPMAAVGAGVVSESDGAYAYLGSSSWISFSAPQPVLDLPEMRTMTFTHVVPQLYVPTATMQAGAGSLSWLAEVLADPETGGVDRFAELTAAAEAVEAATDELYFLPYLLGERSPYWNPAARGAFVGLARHHGPAHLTRAVLEGVAFNLAVCVDAFRQHGQPVERVDAIGGGAASAAWLQILADVWGCVVRRRTVVEDANSLGAAITAGVGVGLFDDFSVARELSEVVSVFQPDPGRHAAYRERQPRFVDAYRRLEPWYGGSK
ncbi:MAG TPA: FGGY family carbohydrate kinase, partial [Propionibacteriaceae bacterium]|nr:FGGY family carbohydrate kinase [Propionibacteriaceae bacterium]